MRNGGLTQQEAAKRTGITRPKVSNMIRGDIILSERKLNDYLNRLDYNIVISVRPANMKSGV